MLIDAFENIAQNYKGTGLLIAGLPEDIEYQKLIEPKIAKSEFADRMVLTTEFDRRPRPFFVFAGGYFRAAFI